MTTPQPSTEDTTMTDLPALEGTLASLVAGARHELDPHLTHIDDPDDKERAARKIVARVLRELSTSTLEEFGGTEREHLDADRLDEMAAELEDGAE